MIVFRLTMASLCAASFMACGNFDPETQLLREVMVKKADLEFDPPGAVVVDINEEPGVAVQSVVRQALSERCQNEGQRTPRCTAEEVAESFNALTFTLIDIVEKIIKEDPTRRVQTRLIWGPFPIDGSSLRFETERNEDDTFSFCLHLSAENVRAGSRVNVTCSDERSEGFLRVLSGTLSPGSNGALREGSGEMVLDANALKEVDEDSDLIGVSVYNYDLSAQERSVNVRLRDVSEEGLLRAGARYSFVENSDGSGRFLFAVREDTTGGPRLEQVEIRSQWNSSLAGRADYLLTGGELGEFQFGGTQCWNDALVTSYHEDDAMADDPDRDVVGDIGACVFDEVLEDGALDED